ncbi:sulfide/dihydroorotate dehydrogenase-like FAD/NAD-binding protein [Nanoarchaeota archaeon]
MNKVLKKQKIAENTYLLELEAPEIAKKIGPGQFVIIRPKEMTSFVCVPVGTTKRKSISVIVKGNSSKDLFNLKKNDKVSDVVGPIGNQTGVEEIENICLITDSYGIPTIYNIAKIYKDKKIQSSIIVGANNKKLLYWEDKLKDVTKNLFFCTEDGSKGLKGDVPFHLRNIFHESILPFELAIISGSPSFMKDVSKFTKQRVKTRAIVNPQMIDPIGLSGTCRIRIDEKIKFATIDGPEFDAHTIDFRELLGRLGKKYNE